MPIDLTFTRAGDRFATRAGWTATITSISALRAEGYIDTDCTRVTCMWRLNGTAEHASDDLVEKLP
jgi:hypothetical protein